jgi:hypothetical protein
MTEDLQKIVAQAYELFAGYKVTKPLDVCSPHCVTDEELDQLVNLNVRKLPKELLSTWNHAAKTDRPELSEFKHFLPRFLDLIAQFEWPSHSVEITLKSFGYYTDRDWTRQERQLIDDFGLAFFKQCLQTYDLPDVVSLDRVIIMLSSAGVDTEPLFLEWEKSPHEASVRHFADFAIYGADLKNEFMEQELRNRMSNWLQKKGVVSNFSKRVEELILNQPNLYVDDQSYLSWAYEHIQFLLRPQGVE